MTTSVLAMVLAALLLPFLVLLVGHRIDRGQSTAPEPLRLEPAPHC
jgi:hypothetical protein